ncbi:hypothetical protein DKX38_018768 [Salix brachista]|uniref:Uncharacterized protein n=1 Tax=Salix brachista TaxID=2182728 RepID=A0A5N5KPR0_9ROSI|nr:hypothetical protein DKX38_018768 [Salix brachista]
MVLILRCFANFSMAKLKTLISLGPERAEKIIIFAGDAVPRKKPDPVHFISLDAEVTPSGFRFMQLKFASRDINCVVVEYSAIGLAAAKAAGMKCAVTKSGKVPFLCFSIPNSKNVF